MYELGVSENVVVLFAMRIPIHIAAIILICLLPATDLCLACLIFGTCSLQLHYTCMSSQEFACMFRMIHFYHKVDVLVCQFFRGQVAIKGKAIHLEYHFSIDLILQLIETQLILIFYYMYN